VQERIRSALQTLLQNTGDDWFIIIEEPEHEKFVQFAFDEPSGLFFDLPFQALTKAELERARKLFAALSVAAQKAPMLDQPGGKEIGQQESFNHHVGRDIDQAVDLACRVFKEVYVLHDSVRLDVTIMR
jgi:hypothetical protein